MIFLDYEKRQGTLNKLWSYNFAIEHTEIIFKKWLTKATDVNQYCKLEHFNYDFSN